ncbi:MAG: hypothetical protein ACRDTE_19240 [Pseudonocardiaceae bacterium]
MRRVLAFLSALVVACALVVAFVRPALAADGQVVVFIADYTDLAVFNNPSGCQILPLGSHVLANLTDEPVTVYQDPLCLSVGPVIEPGDGAHVPPFAGSFKVS